MSYDDDYFTEADFYGGSAPVEDPAEDLGGVTDEAPIEDGQGEVTDSSVEETNDILVVDPNATPTHDYLDPTEYGDKLVKLKVDGEEIEVPLREALQGYQRQADYTRKTQEVAFWKQVDQAMRANPQMTLQYLAQTYGVDVANQAAANQAQQDDDWGFTDPQADRVAQLEQRLEQLAAREAERQAEAHLQQVVQGLSTKYGDDFNATDVIQAAVSRGIYDPSMLEMVYKDLAFDRVRAQTDARSTLTAQQAATAAQRKAAAQQAATVIGSGGGVNRGAVPPPRPPQPRNVREAFQLAKAELGLT